MKDGKSNKNIRKQQLKKEIKELFDYEAKNLKPLKTISKKYNVEKCISYLCEHPEMLT